MKIIDHTDEVLKTLSSISRLIPLVKTMSQLRTLQEMFCTSGLSNIELAQ